MKDAILKGTGDSRYLKSKIPTGTTWEQALAMLNAGTFPVDLNGINSEGFQQLGTPLNKANILKDAVSSKLGLVGDKTPNDMFGVLANCGNLHVWQKTVVTAKEVPAVPAGYTLGDGSSFNLWTMAYATSLNGIFGVYASSSVTVDYSGGVSLTSRITTDNPDYMMNPNVNADAAYDPTYVMNETKGKYVYLRVYDTSNQNMNTECLDKIYYVSNDVAVTKTFYPNGSVENYYVTYAVSGLKEVTGYPYTPAIPAGTTTTYPVSTNRNAYQEGSNAKPAGYVLGDVVSGTFNLGNVGGSSGVPYTVADAVIVSEDGTVSLDNGTNTSIGSGWDIDSLADAQTMLLGKYVVSTSDSVNASPDSSTVLTKLPRDQVVYIPEDAVFTTYQPNTGYYPYIYIDRYQPVTSYPAIGGTIVDYVEKRTEDTEAKVLLNTDGNTLSSYTATFEVADSISIDDSGNVSLVSPSDVSIYFGYNSGYLIGPNDSYIKGKYIKHKSNDKTTVDSFWPGDNAIGYIDSNAVIDITHVTSGTYKLTATITSGAYLISSTPVVYGETMEYLGCLGDKLRMQLLSYVGTGTYGAGNPTSITADFPIKFALYFAMKAGTTISPKFDTNMPIMLGDWVSTSYEDDVGFKDNNYTVLAKKSTDGRTFYWYSTTTASNAPYTQLNYSGYIYYFLVLG